MKIEKWKKFDVVKIVKFLGRRGRVHSNCALLFFSLENQNFSNRNDRLVAMSTTVKRDFKKNVSVARKN